jgi:hypothetical protein
LVEDEELTWCSKDLSTYNHQIEFYWKNQFIQREILKGRTLEQEKEYALNVVNFKIFQSFKKWAGELELTQEIIQSIDSELASLQSKMNFEEKAMGLPKQRLEEIQTQLHNLDKENIQDIYQLARDQNRVVWHLSQADAVEHLIHQPSRDQLSASWRGAQTPWPHLSWDTYRTFLQNQQKNVVVKWRVLKGLEVDNCAKKAWIPYDKLLKSQLKKILNEWGMD